MEGENCWRAATVGRERLDRRNDEGNGLREGARRREGMVAQRGWLKRMGWLERGND